MKPATRLVHLQPLREDPFAASSTPIYQTATFLQPSATEGGVYDYSRSGNPTRSVLEEALAALDGAHRALAYGSGMAALAAVVRLAGAGGEVLAGDDLYGGTYRFLATLQARHGIGVRYVDATNPESVARALSPATRLLLVETPSNPRLKIADLRALARICNEKGLLLAVDGSLLSPYWQRPLELGAHLVIHSATKALSGHSDLTAGVVAAQDPELAQELAYLQNAEGAALGPFESWLLLRSLKTLAVRLERQEENARKIARFLAAHPRVRRVYYPGLADHPGHALHVSQARGAGPMISFETGSFEISRRIVEATRLFSISVSFGGVSSTISLPCRMSHASIPEEIRRERTLPEDLVRLSVGIEHPKDLVADLAGALDEANLL